MTGEQRDRQPQSAGYQIRVRGHLGATVLRAFPAALYGVLAQIEALRLELLEVRHMPPTNRP